MNTFKERTLIILVVLASLFVFVGNGAAQESSNSEEKGTSPPQQETFSIDSAATVESVPVPESSKPAEPVETKAQDIPEPQEKTVTRTSRSYKPWSITYHSHWFLIYGVRVAKQVLDDRTEFSVSGGQSVLRGCGIQSPMCEQGAALNVGIRRYLSTDRFTFYGAFSLHYLLKGVRWVEKPLAIADFNFGMHWQGWSGWRFGMGYSLMLHGSDRPDATIGFTRWFTTEIGHTF